MFDFLTYKTMQDHAKKDEEFIILNSTTMAKHAAELIKNDINLAHKRVILWLDNEEGGSKASESVARAIGYFTALECQVFSASKDFECYNDLNAYWISTKQPFPPKFINLKADSRHPDIENLGFQAWNCTKNMLYLHQ